MRIIIRTLALLAFLLLPANSVSATDCQFVLGFATLRDLIGHEIVGECLEQEHYNEISDSNQQTTGGLMAWRKADNWTAFTDGYRTWINGPNGLVVRLNTERYAWEADHEGYTLVVPAIIATPRPVPTAIPRPIPTAVPTAIPASLPTPSPIPQTSRPTVEACPTTQEQAYFDAISAQIGPMGEATAAMGQLFTRASETPTLILDANWITLVAVQFYILQAASDVLFELEAPTARTEELQEIISTLALSTYLAVESLTVGIDDLNADKILEGNEYLSVATGQASLFTRRVNALC